MSASIEVCALGPCTWHLDTGCMDPEAIWVACAKHIRESHDPSWRYEMPERGLLVGKSDNYRDTFVDAEGNFWLSHVCDDWRFVGPWPRWEWPGRHFQHDRSEPPALPTRWL